LLHPLGYIPAPPLKVIYADDIKTVVDEGNEGMTAYIAAPACYKDFLHTRG
jgi:hypothetical protein